MTFEVKNRDELFERIPDVAGWEALHLAQKSSQPIFEEVQKNKDCGIGKGVVILGGVSAEISQISDAPGLDGFANLFLYLLE